MQDFARKKEDKRRRILMSPDISTTAIPTLLERKTPASSSAKM